MALQQNEDGFAATERDCRGSRTLFQEKKIKERIKDEEEVNKET